jgi:hypothetical protein
LNQWLLYYQALPRDRLLIFSASSLETLNEQLLRENRGQLSSATRVTQFEPVVRSDPPGVENELTGTPTALGDRRGLASTAASDEDGERLAGEFTPDEVAQLIALRAHFQAYPDHPDAISALRRLEFARWLAQNGRLNEGMEPGSADSQKPAA